MCKVFIVTILILFLVIGCASKPTPFKLDAPVQPPMGCTNGRLYGVDC